MEIRGFKTLSYVVIVFLVIGCNSTPKESASAKPNILFIITDQLTSNALSIQGNEYVNTPSIDKLAASGVRFNNCYATQPLCLPSRSSFQTGRYPHELGTVNNGKNMNINTPMLGFLMEGAGYNCKYIGKWHVGLKPAKAGYLDYDDAGKDDKKTETAIKYLKEDYREPFFLTVSYMNPHNVCELARDQELPDGPIGDPPSKLEDLPPLPANFDFPDDEPSVIRKIQKKSKVHYPTKDWDELKWRQYLWGYYKLVEKVDGEIGRVLDALSESGLEDNTVVVFTSDHGEGVAMHHWNQKQILYDQSVKVPLILSLPGVGEGIENDFLISNGLDIPVTILDIANIEKPSTMKGISLLPALKGELITERDFIVSETMFARGDKELGATGRMIRTENYKYIIYDNGKRREQLFDMVADPGELKNLVKKKKHSKTLQQHRQLIKQWAQETGDDGFNYKEE